MESLACGVLVVCGSYGGQAEFVPKWMQVDPIGYYYEGGFCSKRPVHDPVLWANGVQDIVNQRSGVHVGIPDEINWNGSVLWPSWREWFLRGLREGVK
jgi:hypothetical protein